MAETQRQRKMVNIDVVETSGVDHPAHLAEGWIVCKSATPQDVEGIFGPLTTEGNATMATNDQTGTPTVADLQKSLKDTQAELAAAKEALAKAAKPAAESTQEDMLKGLPAELRERIQKAEGVAEDLKKQADADREALQKERDARLDERAVTEAQGMFKSVAVDPSTVGPALRRLAIFDADLHKSVSEALLAADNQLATANIFKAAGKDGADSGDTAEARLEKAADAVLADDPTLTRPQAVAKAVEANPKLYDDIQAEKAGK